MRKRLIFAICVIGASGMIAQILLLRELLITFNGNELSIGIILANWLILESIGAFFLGKRIEKIKRQVEAFICFTLLFSLSFPIGVYLARILKEIIGIAAGEGLGLLPMFYSSFIILLPISLSHGVLFTFGCKIYSLYSRQQDAASIGKVYIFETLGTVAGGVAFTYLLIPYFHSIQIALGVSLVNFILCILLLGPFRYNAQILRTKFLNIILVISLLFTGLLIFGAGADKIHWFSIKQQWPGQQVVYYQNSIYGNVAVTKRDEQWTFFSDGIPIITTPTPDITFVEEFVHFPMLSHPDPKEILVISGGAGGVINEILKHPVMRVDYVELDPLLLKAIVRFPTLLTEAELNDPRVNIKYMDGRFFVQKVLHKYDLVLVGLSNPQDLQINRLFTKEFFSLVKNRLKEEGILVISLPGSLTYLSGELKNLNACILNTLKNVYPHILIIPGDDINLFLASAFKGVSQIDALKLNQRLKIRNLKVSLLTPAYIEYRLAPRWRDWFLKSLKSGTEKINLDCFFLIFSLWGYSSASPIGMLVFLLICAVYLDGLKR